jgi:hypothetical protein
MAQAPNKGSKGVISSDSVWSNFKQTKDGSSADLIQRVKTIQSAVQKESKIFGTNSLVDGGTKVKG